MKKLLQEMEKHLKLSTDELAKYKDSLEEVSDILIEENIYFEENFKLVFFSHILNFIKRLETKEQLVCGDENPIDEVGIKAIRVSQRIIDFLQIKYKSEYNPLEVTLAGIQLQLAIEMAEEN